MPSFITLTATIASLVAVSMAAPTATSSSAPACTSGTLTSPTMYNLYPGEPSKTEPSTAYIDIQNQEGETEREQVAIFHGIPADAKMCTLRWLQAAAEDRQFEVEDNGYTKVTPFSEFVGSCDVVNYENVMPLVEKSDATTLGPDFSFWDDDLSAVPHTAGEIDCAETIYFHVRINEVNGEGSVLMKQNEQNGFVIDYTC